MMGLGARNPLIPFSAGGGFLIVLIVTATSFVACFALAATLSASRLAEAWTTGLSDAATVRIAHVEGQSAQRVGIVLDILRGSDGVMHAEPLAAVDVAELLAPWFGETPDIESLPTPSVVAVTLDPNSEPDPAIIQARLDGAVAGAVYDDHGQWRSEASNAASAVKAIAVGALIAAAIATAAVVILSVQQGLAAQREVISALRLSGAEDGFVAGLYQRRFLWLGIFGAVLGCAIAAGAFVLFDAVASVSSALPILDLPRFWWLGALGVVVFCGVTAMIAARISVLAKLRLTQ